MPNQKKPIKLTQGYIKQLIRNTIENDDIIDEIIQNKVHQLLVEHGVPVKNKKKTREDILLEKLEELKKLEAQVLSELGHPVQSLPSNNNIDPEKEINRRIREMEFRQEELSEDEKIALQILKETKGATNNSSIADYASASDRVDPTLLNRSYVQDPRSIVSSVYNSIPQNASMIADPEEALQHFEQEARKSEPMQVDPAKRLENHFKNMGITEDAGIIGPVFAKPKDLEKAH